VEDRQVESFDLSSLAPSDSAKAPDAKAEVKEVVKEEEADVEMGGLFGDDEY